MNQPAPWGQATPGWAPAPPAPAAQPAPAPQAPAEGYYPQPQALPGATAAAALAADDKGTPVPVPLPGAAVAKIPAQPHQTEADIAHQWFSHLRQVVAEMRTVLGHLSHGSVMTAAEDAGGAIADVLLHGL